MSPNEDAAIIMVGWLQRGEDFPTGEMPADAFAKLTELAKDAWMPLANAGYHQCEICQFDGTPMKDEIYVPGEGCIYVAPKGVLHYIAVHWFLPPPGFVEAVLACPPMRSMEYKRALLANGGRGLIKPGS